MRTTGRLLLLGLCAAVWSGSPSHAAEAAPEGGVFAKSNLVAWCIVPFDAKQRSPQQRAEMLLRLGIRKLAYDWRGEHVPTFEDEILQCQKHEIEYFAFWGSHPEIFPLLAKHRQKPQFWITVPSPAGSQEERVAAAAKQLSAMAEKTRDVGCQLGLYNHGGWGGEPRNMVAVVERLRAEGQNDHVGIIYNLHHGHDHIQDFAEVLALMKPYLLCLNLNGMNDGAKPKILPVGAGQHDRPMIEAVKSSGYAGPIGILDHRSDMDAEVALRQNLDGLKKLLEQIGDAAALKTYD